MKTLRKITNLDFYRDEPRAHLFEALAYRYCERAAAKGRCSKLQRSFMRREMREAALRAVKAVRLTLVRDQRFAA
ncbi:MAG: hypothetical protein H2172_16335 [Opitutus sp.]|nr:hypothetical protein [Opitutus sp.]MCS6248713.1 hypothetical protein [Opitutus sp.]MCS6275574.1 hypothetical protein [Opitutus sp.]MCS6299796.1 hypothetical protein [Opitutus sp.]